MMSTSEVSLGIRESDGHCSKDALTDTLGWFLQGLLAGMAFTGLICKYKNNIDNWISLKRYLNI